MFKTPQHEQTYTENQEKEIETATLLQGSRAISEYVRPPTSSENTGLTPGEGNLFDIGILKKILTEVHVCQNGELNFTFTPVPCFAQIIFPVSLLRYGQVTFVETICLHNFAYTNKA